MNYDPNRLHWEIGSLVLHDADTKNTEMLMEVIGYTRMGQCKTRYVQRMPGRRGTWINHISFLHDPARFGVETQ